MQQADLHVVTPEKDGGIIKVDQIRELQRSLILTPYEAKFRIALILNFQRGNVNAQNALLKTLEEAPRKVILLLTANSAESLLPTISSRCEILRLRPTSIENLTTSLIEKEKLAPEKASLYAHIANGRPGIALRLAHDPKIDEKRVDWINSLLELMGYSIRQKMKFSENLNKDKNDAPLADILQVWTSFTRDLLLVQQKKQTNVVNTDYSKQLIEIARQLTIEQVLVLIGDLMKSLEMVEINANPRMMLDNLFIRMPELN